PSSSLRSQPPPRPTLFPYTTLFRSRGEASDELERPPGDLRPLFARKNPGERLLAEVEKGLQFSRAADAAGFDFSKRYDDAQCSLDRKSTRLNSSHVAIPYAVLCLKK